MLSTHCSNGSVFMDNRWLVLGGWSLSPAILHPIFGNNAYYVDINYIVNELIDTNNALKSSWHSQLCDSILNQTGGSFCGLAGWSTGAFCAYSLRQEFPQLPTILISAAPSFCSRANFPYGQNPSVVKIMRRQLQRNATPVLKSFRQQCGIPNDYPLTTTDYSVDALCAGLLFLEQVSLLPLTKTDSPLHLFHGTDDSVIPIDGARLFEEAGAAVHYYSGNHVFFLESNAQRDIKECCNICV